MRRRRRGQTYAMRGANSFRAISRRFGAEQISRILRGLVWKQRLDLGIFEILRPSFFAAQCFVKQRAVGRYGF